MFLFSISCFKSNLGPNLNFFYRQIVALLAQDINNNGSPVLNRFIYPETKIFLVDPLTLTSKDISISSSVLYSKSITLFSLRNQLYSAGEFDLITRFYRLNLSNCSMDTLVDVPHVLQLTDESTTFVMSLPFYEWLEILYVLCV